MKGYIYQIIEIDYELLYWSSKELNEEQLGDTYLTFIQSDEDVIASGFESYWNQNNDNKVKIERIFVNEIYV